MNELWENIKSLADNLQQPTIRELLKIEKRYDDKEDLLDQLEKAYLNLNLSEEARKTIDDLMLIRLDIDSNCNCLAYIAGLIDCFTFLKVRELISDV